MVSIHAHPRFLSEGIHGDHDPFWFDHYVIGMDHDSMDRDPCLFFDPMVDIVLVWITPNRSVIMDRIDFMLYLNVF